MAADQILKEAIQDFPAVGIEGKAIMDEEVDPVTICNQQSGRGQAANIFLSLESKCCLPPVGLHLPDAWRSKT